MALFCRTTWSGSLGAALAALCLAGSGCATVRQAREAQDSRRVPAGERTVTAAELGLKAETVLTLERAVEVALAYHPSMVQARQAVVAASNALTQAKAARAPSVDANAGYSRGTANAGTAPGSNKSIDGYSAGLSVNQLLYDFGRTAASVTQAEALLQSAEENLRSVHNDVVYGTRVAFYELSRSQEFLGVAEETERQYVKRLEQVRALAEVGRRIKYDITKAEVDLGNARLDLINARNAVTVDRATLMRGLGLAEDPRCRIADCPPREVAWTFEDRLEVARRMQPGLKALQAQARAASAAVDAAVADLYPSLSLNGQYLWNGSAFPLYWNWAGAARAGWNLFNGGSKAAAVNVAVANLRIARALAADREQQICLDLRTAFTQLEGAREQEELTVLIVKQAGENLDLVNERYRIGQASSVELTDAQVSLSQARANQVKARFDYQSAMAAIIRTTGEEE